MSWRVWAVQVGALACLVVPAHVRAHSMHAALLRIAPSGEPTTTRVVLKIPRTENGPRHLEVAFPITCPIVKKPVTRATPDAWVESWQLGCAVDALRDQRIEVQGLDPIVGELVVHVVAQPPWTTVIDRDSPSAVLSPRGTSPEGAPALAPTAFFWLGGDHILSGLDHLMFVFALVLLVVRTRHDRLVATVFGTITAFTVAHSLTLAGSVLGWVALPAAPVEVVIALSVLLLAVELTEVAPERTLTARYPWVVAFLFGLLHGFGFAGALRQIGLPDGAVGSALLWFNVGVEAGQLAFVVALGLLWALARVARSRFESASQVRPRAFERVAAYAIGTMSVYWCWHRIWMG